jgi:hypothetical protein
MYPARRRSGVPPFTTSSLPQRTLALAARSLAVGAAVLALPLASCSSGDDTSAIPSARPPAGADGSSGPSSDPDAVVAFGDPGDFEGFAPVTDVEVDPVDSDELEPPDLSDPDSVVPDLAQRLEDGEQDGDLLDRIGIVDQGVDQVTERDGRTRNEAGEPATLDEAANLACAQIELAIDQLDGGIPSVAAERIISGSDRARSSKLTGIQAWADPLAGVVVDGSYADPAPLVGFLSVCTEGGYEL